MKTKLIADPWCRWHCAICGKEGAARGQDQADLMELEHTKHSHPQLVESEARERL